MMFYFSKREHATQHVNQRRWPLFASQLFVIYVFKFFTAFSVRFCQSFFFPQGKSIGKAKIRSPKE